MRERMDHPWDTRDGIISSGRMRHSISSGFVSGENEMNNFDSSLNVHSMVVGGDDVA